MTRLLRLQRSTRKGNLSWRLSCCVTLLDLVGDWGGVEGKRRRRGDEGRESVCISAIKAFYFLTVHGFRIWSGSTGQVGISSKVATPSTIPFLYDSEPRGREADAIVHFSIFGHLQAFSHILFFLPMGMGRGT